jgi:hypothetical protein
LGVVVAGRDFGGVAFVPTATTDALRDCIC